MIDRTADRVASAGGGPPIPLAYPAGGVRCHHDGSFVQVFVPADRHARRARVFSFTSWMIGGVAVLLWPVWRPFARALFDGAQDSILVATAAGAVGATAILAGVYAAFAWLVVSARTREMLISATPAGLRYEVIGTDRSTFIPRSSITAVCCQRLLGGPPTYLVVRGRIGPLARLLHWPTQRQVATGSRAELEAVAVDLRAVLGLPSAAEATR